MKKSPPQLQKPCKLDYGVYFEWPFGRKEQTMTVKQLIDLLKSMEACYGSSTEVFLDAQDGRGALSLISADFESSDEEELEGSILLVGSDL
jgi:hypothetical protein